MSRPEDAESSSSSRARRQDDDAGTGTGTESSSTSSPRQDEDAKPESSSHARQNEDDDPEQPQRPWVALVSAAVVLAHGKKGALRTIPRGTDFYLKLAEPPQLSCLILGLRIAPAPPVGPHTHGKPSAYILADDRSGFLLLQATDPGKPGPELLLCNAHTRKVLRLPTAPSSLLAGAEAERRRSSMGLIANKDRLGHHLVAVLLPGGSVLIGNRLLCYDTATGRWSIKPVDLQVPFPDPKQIIPTCSEAEVLTHNGRMWWLPLAYGIFVWDPFPNPDPDADRRTAPTLRFVPLPSGCEILEEPFDRVLVTQRRRVAPSEGLLRYVEVRGLSYDDDDGDAAPPPVNPRVCMWTLIDPELKAVNMSTPWRFEYEASFAEIWAHHCYTDERLPHGMVSHIAFVDPNDHCVVYFSKDSTLFRLDVRSRRVTFSECEESLVEEQGYMILKTSRPLIDSWHLPLRHDFPSEASEGKSGYIVRKEEQQRGPFVAPPAPVLEIQPSSSSSDEETPVEKASRKIKEKIELEMDPGLIDKLKREHKYVMNFVDTHDSPSDQSEYGDA